MLGLGQDRHLQTNGHYYSTNPMVKMKPTNPARCALRYSGSLRAACCFGAAPGPR
jgi:hypothetical protein